MWLKTSWDLWLRLVITGVFPVLLLLGVLVMWLKTSWDLWLKRVITGVFAVLLLLVVGVGAYTLLLYIAFSEMPS